VSAAHAVGRIVRIAKMQEWRQHKAHAETLGQSACAGERPAVGKGGGMDEIERPHLAAGCRPHVPGKRIPRHSECLPTAMWDKGERLDDERLKRQPQEGVAPNLDAVFPPPTGSDSLAAGGKEVLQVDDVGREDSDLVAGGSQVTAQACKVRLGPSK